MSASLTLRLLLFVAVLCLTTTSLTLRKSELMRRVIRNNKNKVFVLLKKVPVEIEVCVYPCGSTNKSKYWVSVSAGCPNINLVSILSLILVV